MKNLFKYKHLAASVLLLVNINSEGRKHVQTTGISLSDSSFSKSNVREVLTGQQLFVVELSKHKKTGGKTAKFKAELRDAFKVISYEKDSASTLVNWKMCSEKCKPAPGTYYPGTKEYKKLDSLLAQVIAK